MVKLIGVAVCLLAFVGGTCDGQSQAPAQSPPRHASCSIEHDRTSIECQWADGASEGYISKLFTAENTPNIALFVVGTVGVFVALVTLSKIERQTKATEKAAVVALKQVAIQQESLRPRLTIGTFSGGTYGEMAQGKRVSLEAHIFNGGGIPAFQVIPETWIEWLSSPFKFTAAAIYTKGQPIAVHLNQPTHYFIPFNRSLTEAEILDLRNAKATICLRFRLTYSAFGQPAHTQEAFVIQPDRVQILPEYSDYS